jgi:pyridoxine kinase
MNILSLQSHVAYGHVGNSAAVFALQRIGIEAWPVHTVQLSNHTGYDTARGRAFDMAHIRDVVQGLAERGALARCDGVLSGYLGSAETGAAILEAVETVKRANSKALYCCDPVMGDVGSGLFVKPGVAEFMRERAVPLADVVTPNHFELEMLTGRPSRHIEAVLTAVDELRARGPRIVLVTSLVTDAIPVDAVDLVACDAGGRLHLRVPKLPIAAHGAGDLIAALFFAQLLRTGSVADALPLAASAVHGVLARTAASAEEMALIEAQAELAAPSRIFRPEPL